MSLNMILGEIARVSIVFNYVFANNNTRGGTWPF